ncbi:MAG: hypothetical protein ABIS07_00410 [Dokdonella sp.]
MSLLESQRRRVFLNARAHARGSVTVGYVVVTIAGLCIGAIAGFIIALFAGLIPFSC